MKLLKEESIPKLDKCWGSLQKSFAGGSRPLGPKNYQEQRPRPSLLMILLLFHLPAMGCSKSRKCIKPGPWFTALQDIRRTNAAKPFPIRQFKCMNCDD